MAKKNKEQQAASGGFVPATAQSAKHAAQPIAAGTSGQTGLAGQYSRNNPNYQSHNQGTSRGAKIGIAIFIVVLVAAVAGAGFYVYKEMQKSSINADLHKMSAEQMELVDKELTGSKKFDEPFNMLLLGSDARADDPDMGARTDTIIVVRVDPNENIVSLMSIPRDTMIEIEGVGVDKFNAAYTYGGASGTIAAVKKLCGIDIDHYAEINFEGLVGLVDAIGGIDVVVDEEIDDEDAGGHVDAGKQHLDGEHALILARSRAYVDGDYTRQVNQRKVIMAIVNKGLTAPATELSGLIQASTKFLTTDSGIDFDFIYSLADQIRHNNDKPINIYSATIPSSTATINEISYVIADTAGVKEMTKIFLKGGDIGKGVTASSIEEDKEKAGANKSSNSSESQEVGSIGEEYEEVVYYEEPQQEYDVSTYADTGQGEGATYDAGADTADTGGAGDVGAGDAGADAGDAGAVDETQEAPDVGFD